MSSNDLPIGLAPAGAPFVGRMLMRLFARIEVGSLVLHDPSGSMATFGHAGTGPHAELYISDWRAASEILKRGDCGFAESLRRGWLGCPDMLSLFTLALRNEAGASQAVSGKWWALLASRLRHLLLRDNSRRGSRKNILSHYDLGNTFYALWLDESMTYSSGLFEGDNTRSILDAQHAKYDHIIDALHATPGQTVLEVGCGWGGFAERAAQRGLNVVGITLSDAQLAYAQARIARLGLTDRVDLRLMDYRDLKGQTFDHIVSIEMVEAVGERRWPLYFATLAQCLRPGGRIVIQAIDISDDRYEAYRQGTDFIQQYVFPGGMLPAPAAFASQVSMAGLSVVSRLSFGIDYAQTLLHWRHAFEANLSTILQQGFDEAFVRIWRMYLCYCEAGFREQRTDVKIWTLELASQTAPSGPTS